MKLQLGTGDNFLNGYENTDLPAIDLTKPLPYADESAEIVVAAHVLELLRFREVPLAMQEIRRVLKTGGWARFHFGAEPIALTPLKLAEMLVACAGGRWECFHVDKTTTHTGDEEILRAKGQHGPAIVIELKKL